MPRIDPIQLLRCLSVLLSPNGGIRSNDEVHRLASLMTKFSKKLVSKCIYIQILKCTETELLGSFMGSGGWRLVHMWLTESIAAKNWPLVRELLELLLLCPVDIDILKTNNCPKLVKELSRDGSQAAIRALATRLVEQWLKTVKGEPVILVSESDFPQIINEAISNTEVSDEISESCNERIVDPQIQSNDNNIDGVNESSMVVDETPTNRKETKCIDECEKEIETLPILKISLKDGKQVISKLDESDQSKRTESITIDKDNKTRKKSDDGKTGSSRSSSKHSSSSRSHSSKSSSSDRHRSSSKSSSSHKDKSKDRSKDSLRHSSSSDKHKDKKHSDKSHSSSSSHRYKSDKTKYEKLSKNEKRKDDKSSKSSKDHNSASDREENEKSKEIVDKLRPPPISKLMKIPKVSEAVKRESPSISIETRKPNDPNRPKTVKTFNSKFRSHGLEEEAKPPSPRGSVVKKPPPTHPPTVAIPKRQSPSHNTEAPPEKKSKITEPSEKPGSIKLIPAKPKPVLLLESDMFMDALNASATNKKEPKKRKRRTSGSKDGNPSTDSSPPNTPTAPPASSSPSQEAKSTPFRFYNDTLETEEDKEKEKAADIDSKVESKLEATCEPEHTQVDDKIEDKEPHVRTAPNGLRGVLCYHKRKGPKKSIRWRPDSELEQIQYFELDETERVNVSKTFMDMKQLERVHEREAFQKARNLINEDVMEVKTNWRPLIPVDVGGAIVVEYGKNSKEREIQAARQKSVLQSLYLKSMIPDSPSDPEPETHTHSEPTIMPLDDVTGNPDTVSDFRNTPWPDPKGSTSSSSVIPNNINMPQNIFPPISQFPTSFPNSQFTIPNYQGSGPGMMQPGGEWQNNMPPNVMIPGGMPPGPMAQGPGPMPPILMNPTNMPPGLMLPNDRGIMGPDMFGGPGQNIFPGPAPMPPEGFNMMENINVPPQNMFPPGFPVNMVPPLPGHDNVGPFPFGGRGGMRGRGSVNQWRGGWDGPIRGRGGLGPQGGWKKAKCIHFLKKGSCRQGESCAFMHPGVNCPF